jgi:ABC-type Zn uptake system ZnuABC Zn-binding protein ZnuA
MTVSFWRGVRPGISLCVALSLALIAGACGDSDGGDPGTVQVVTTLPLFADFVREIGGDRVEVSSLVPTGADPHTFEPSPSDVKKVAQADIAFANGLDLEPAAEKLIEANLPDGAPFVKLGEAKDIPLPSDHTRLQP